jgi:hypothetical protein
MTDKEGICILIIKVNTVRNIQQETYEALHQTTAERHPPRENIDLLITIGLVLVISVLNSLGGLLNLSHPLPWQAWGLSRLGSW